MTYGTLLIIAAAVAVAIMTVGIVDVIRLGRERFAAAGKRRWHWVLLIIYSGPLGVLLYAAAARPQVAHPERYADDNTDAVADGAADGLADNPGSAAIGEHAR